MRVPEPGYCYVWEYVVADTSVPAFEGAYGAGGPWVRFFSRDESYQGTTLLRDRARPGRYLTFDCWRTREAFARFRERFHDEYAAIDARCEQLTASERFLGAFSPVATSSPPQHLP